MNNVTDTYYCTIKRKEQTVSVYKYGPSKCSLLYAIMSKEWLYIVFWGVTNLHIHLDLMLRTSTEALVPLLFVRHFCLELHRQWPPRLTSVADLTNAPAAE